MRLRNLVSLIAAAVMCILSAGMIATAPVALYRMMQGISGYGVLDINNIVLAITALVGGWCGYIALRFSIALLRIHIRMLREGRKKDNEADAAIIEASLVWPIRGKARGENAV